MRRNRVRPKNLSVVESGTMCLGAILLCGFVMAILIVLSSSSCTQLMKVKGGLEKELARLEDEYTRESTSWEGMKTPESVELALRRHGLAMKMPRPDQIVHMKGDGTPYPGQLSLARVRQRCALTVAQAPARRRRSR